MKQFKKMLALLLAMCTLMGVCIIPAGAASIQDGSKTCTVGLAEAHAFLQTTAGTMLRGRAFEYQTNDGLTGPAFCIDHGLEWTAQALPITGKYTTSPPTAGAMANGYPQHHVDTFLGLHLADHPVLAGLTEAEYQYATQLAVWATLGQLGIEGTPYTSGREFIATPTSDLQQMRVFQAVQLICATAATWDRVYQTGMYIRTSENALDGNTAIPGHMTLEFAADENQYGIKAEVINGKSYYTKEYIVASATSTYWQDYTMEVWATGCPAGTIFTDLANVELPRSKWRETDTWRTKLSHNYTTLNSNGFEFWGKVKMCIPVDTAPPAGEITIHCAAQVMQYDIYLANNESNSQQSYIIGDPSKGTKEADAVLSWGGPATLTGNLKVIKVGGGGIQLPGAVFALDGTDGTHRTGTTNEKGEITWESLDPAATYTLTEVTPPAGYGIAEPVTVKVKAAHTEFVTVRDEAAKVIRVRKIDRQNGYALRGAVLCFEQVDGAFKTTAVTDQAGYVQFSADQLPIGTYKIYEVQAPEGYELDSTPQTVHWDGLRDVTLTFKDTRKPTLIIAKQDSVTKYGLIGATFEVYKNGSLITTVTTNDNGLAYASGLTSGYYEVKEVAAPQGYTLNEKVYGVNIDLYNPATDEDPRLVVENDPMPSLMVVKYDRETMKPLKDTTFKVYKDGKLLGTYVTDANGEILLTGLEPGTYAVEEINSATHVADAPPQQIELAAGRTDVAKLVFLNSTKPGIHLVKLDEKTMKPLAGAAFRISKVGGAYSKELLTDKNGEIDLTNLEPGAYTVQESAAPAGYLLDQAARTVEVKAGQNVEFVFTDLAKPSLQLLKKGQDGKPLEGVSFRISKVGDTAHIYNRTTDKAGEISFTDLEPGIYSVQETATLGNYVLDGTEHHVKLQPGETSTILLTNQEKPSLKVSKFDRQSGKPMSSVTFEIFRDTTSLGKHQTNAQGEIVLNYVDPGTYKAVEVDTGDDSHILTTTPQEVELHAGDGLRELVFINDKLPGLHLVKLDRSDLATPIPNAKFRFTAVNGSYGPVERTTEQDGTIDLSNLPVGTYQVVELECPGYVVDDAQRLIHLNGNETAQFVFTNTKLPGLILTKLSADGSPLEGVTFRIAYVEDGTRYMDKTTDKDGKIQLSDLDPGVLSVMETATLPTHIIDSVEHHVELKAGKVATLVLKNDRRPNLTIHKKDADTGEAIPNTTFEVKAPDGHSIAEVTTGEDGSVTVHNLLPGIYEVVEKAVPAPYLLDADKQTVTLYPNRDRDVYFENHKKPGLTINKVDSVTGDSLEGVKFSVTYASNNTASGEINELGTFTTDSKGQIFIDRLKDGWYKVTELEPKFGYAVKGNPTQECYIKSGTTKVLTFENTPLSALVVWKYDSVFGTAVEGATFRVRFLGGTSGTGGTVIGTFKTSANGSFTVTGLEAGTYVVEEMSSDEGHVIDTAPQTAVLTGKQQDVVQLHFGNSPKASLTVKKIDAATHKPLADVEFLVTLADGSLVGDANGKFKTDSNGTFTIGNLAPGTSLVVKETVARPGYLLDDTAQTITVKAGQAAVLEFRNQPKGNLTVLKKDSLTGNPLEGVTFKITFADGSYVPNAEGKLSSNGLYKTDKEGKITISNVSGTLVVTEVASIPGYLIDPNTQVQTVVVNPDDTQTLTFYNKPTTTLVINKYVEGTDNEPLAGVTFQITDSSGKVIGPNNGRYVTDKDGKITLTGLTPGTTVTAQEVKTVEGYKLDGKPQSILIKEGETQGLTFWNERIGQVEIIKVSSADKSQRIPDVSFEIRKVDGTLVGTITTGSKGRAALPLEDGDYYAVEIDCPKDYKLDSAPHYFTIKGGTTTLTIKNDPISGILIHKIDAATGKGIYGVNFLLYNSKMTPIGQYTSDQNGYVFIDDLAESGRYYLREMDNEGYLPDTRMNTIYVTAGETTLVEWKNTPITGQIQLTKTSADYNTVNGWAAGTAIPGTEFEVYNRAGVLVDTIRTDKNGVAVTRALPLGRYTLVESKAAANYQLDKTPIPVEIEFAGQIVRAAMTNKSIQVGVNIQKTGYAEVMPGQAIRYTLSGTGNTSNVSLENFYWRDMLPVNAVRLSRITTGTWNAQGNYKIVYKTNLSGGAYRVLADNLSTRKNYTLDASPVALRLASNECVTEIMAVYGIVPAGFAQVEAPNVECSVVNGLAGGFQFVNQADVGGTYNGQWIMGTSRWTTTVYAPVRPLPRTGY